tara:strand:- start:369 stop:896 length:528 start_codon:yes stop_codon:yes gene_type:complete
MPITLNGNGTATGLSAAPNLTSSGLTTGKVIQVVTAGTNAQITSTTTSLAEITSDLRVSITPTNANNLILVQGFFGNLHSQTHVITLQIMKDGTTAVDPPNSSNTASDGNLLVWSSQDYMMNGSTCVSETAGSTTTRYYTPFWRINTATLYLNCYRASGYPYKTTSRMVAMEIEV